MQPVHHTPNVQLRWLTRKQVSSVICKHCVVGVVTDGAEP